MIATLSTKYMTEGEAGLGLALAVGVLLCLVGAANAQDAAFGFMRIWGQRRALPDSSRS